MTTTYGIMSDMHRAPLEVVAQGVKTLQERGAQKLILNGDLVGDQNPTIANQDYLFNVLEMAAKTGLETYALPGSHEEVAEFHPVLLDVASRRSNIKNIFDNPKVEADDHHLVFLPGSDWRAGGAVNAGYSMEAENPTGIYQNGADYLAVANMGDLRKLITQPERTVVISHVPRKFGNIEHSVDMAYFAEQSDGTLMPGVMLEGMIRQQAGNVSESQLNQIARANGFQFKRENRGNYYLREVFEELGVTKSVTGHFHESAHRANDRDGRPVAEGTPTQELFWMGSYVDGHKVGLLTVDDVKVAYKNIGLK